VAEAGTGVSTRIFETQGRSGQALVELAFVLPLVLLLLFGIIDFGLAYNTKNSDTNLANLAARAVSVMGTSTTTQSCGGSSKASLTAWIDCVATTDSEPVPATVCVWDSSGGAYAAGDGLESRLIHHQVVRASSVRTEDSARRSEQTRRPYRGFDGLCSTTNPFVTAAGGTTQCTS